MLCLHLLHLLECPLPSYLQIGFQCPSTQVYIPSANANACLPTPFIKPLLT